MIVGHDVFPPNESPSAAVLAKAIRLYKPRVALDLGCGSGYLALLLKKYGAEIVYASDHHSAAIACTRKNVRLNHGLKPVRVIKSDLLTRIPTSARIDLIVFNHPLYPLKKTMFGMGQDGGKNLIHRFLSQLRDHPAARTASVLMPYRNDIPPRHNVAAIARLMGFRSRIVATLTHAGIGHYVYELHCPTARKRDGGYK